MTKAELIQRHLNEIQSLAKEMKEHAIDHINFNTGKYGELHLNLFKEL